MSELRLAYPASVLADKPEITAGDVHLLETRVFRPGPSERDDIAVLLALHHSRSRKCAEWEPFFVDQMVRNVLARITEIGGDTGAVESWMRHTFCRGGVIASRAEFRVVVEVVEILRDTCPELAAFALEQIHIAVAESEGPLASRRNSPWATLSTDNLSFANRILAALGSHTPLTLHQAARLFDPARNLAGIQHGTAFDELIAGLSNFPQVAA